MTQAASAPGDPGVEAIYSQHCDFYRHQDNMMWGRFQTASTVEAALIVGLNTLKPEAERTFLLCAGAVLVFLISILAIKDSHDARRHLDMIKAYETAHPLPESRWPSWLSGRVFMWVAVVILNLANAWLLCPF
jgi:hypothetical protein